MEEKKCRRRSLRNLRRSSSNWVVPSEAVLRGIEIERQNLLQISSAYGSAWLGEHTTQDLIINSQRDIPKDATSGFFPSLDFCATDETPLPAKVLKNSDPDWPQPTEPSSKPPTETQSSSRIEFEVSHSLSKVSSNSSPLTVQDIGKIKSPSFLSLHLSMDHHKRAQNQNFVCASSKTSLNNQNRKTDASKLKPQKKEGSLKCEHLNSNLQQAKAKSNWSSGATPSFLKTTQSFALKHSVVNNLQSLKQSVNIVRATKAKKMDRPHSPSKAGHFVTIQSHPLLDSAVRKDVRPDLQNSTRNTLKSSNRDHSVITNGERDKLKSRKKLSLRKSIKVTDPGLDENIKIRSFSRENDKDLKGNSGYASPFMTSLINVNCEMDNKKFNIDRIVKSPIKDTTFLKSSNFDIEMTEELLKSFDLPLFPSSQSIQETRDKDKRKSQLRTSRYFSPFEMPLAKPSLEDEPESLDSLGTSFDGDSPFTVTPSDEGKKPMKVGSTSLNGLTTADCPNENRRMTPVLSICTESSVGIDLEVSPLCNSTYNKENMAGEINNSNNLLTGPGKHYFYEANIELLEEMMDDFKNMCVVEEQKQDKRLHVSENMSNRAEAVSFDVNGNRRDSGAFKTIISNCTTLSDGPTRSVGSDQRSHGKICTTTAENQVEMMELTSDKNTICSVDSEVEMTEHESSQPESISDIFYMESMNVKRTLRARKSWDFSQAAKPQEGKSARKRNSDGPSTASARSKKRPAESRAGGAPRKGEKEISPGLRDLYTNKNYVLPKSKTWETIKESPPDDRSIFTKQKTKRFLEFEAGVTTAKLQRRHKKALELKKKAGIQTMAVSEEEFRRKLLDVQFLLGE